MRCTFLCAFWALLVLPLTACAVIPLTLEAEVVFPRNAAWDIQHLTNDSTYAWVWAADSVIHYAVHPDSAERQFVVPSSAYVDLADDSYEDVFYRTVFVNWIRLPSAPQDDCVLWIGMGGWWEYDVEHEYYYYMLIVNLTQGFVVGSCLEYGTYQRLNGHTGVLTEVTLTKPEPWPPLPAVTQKILYTRSWLTNHWYGDEDDYSRGNTIYSIPADSLPVHRTPLLSGGSFRLLADSTLWDLAFGGYSYDQAQGTSESHVGLYNLSSGVGSADSAHGSEIVPQQDGDGTLRLITHAYPSTTALHPETYTTLWTIPRLWGTLYTLKPQGGANEWILEKRTDNSQLRAYSGATGLLIDVTAPIAGVPAYVVKNARTHDVLVTWEYSTSLARLYTLGLPQVTGLTCCYAPASGLLELRWQPLAGSALYTVWMTAADGSSPTQLATTTATTLSLAPSAANDVRLFHVTADFLNRQ